MPTDSSSILHVPQKGSHFCQLHRNAQTLDAALLVYVTAGIEKGEAVVVFSNAMRLNMIRNHLTVSGHDCVALETSGQLALNDGSRVLEQFLAPGKPDWTGFRERVESTLESLSGWPVCRAYGDMVNELWRAGRSDETISLEKLWNEILQDSAFPLFCGYEFDSLDPAAYVDPVRNIGFVHDEVMSTEDDVHAVRALDRACAETIGFSLSSIIRCSLPESRSEPALPTAQRIVMWLERNTPSKTKPILERAREFFDSSTMTAGLAADPPQ